MDEVRARRALQRVAYTEDWLEKLKDDLAAGHARSAMTHLITAQAELKLLSEQLAPEMGWAAEPTVEMAPAMSLATPAFALPGVPRRSPLAWASLAIATIAVVLYTGVLMPRRTSSPAPIQPLTETGDPATTLAALPALPAPASLEPSTSANDTVTPTSVITEPVAGITSPEPVEVAQSAPPRRIRARHPQPQPVATPPTANADPLPSETVPASAEPTMVAAEPAAAISDGVKFDAAQLFKQLLDG